LEPLSAKPAYPLPFDLLARAILASDAATDIEVPLNFFRRGLLDVYDGAYIEAIYDFFFVLETCFGGGKYKKAQVLTAFQASGRLRSCVVALRRPFPILNAGSQVIYAF
jgi:hypothetical protein